MAAGSSRGWIKGIASSIFCEPRIDDETEEVNQSSSGTSCHGESEEVNDEALKAVRNNDVEALYRILSGTDSNSHLNLREKVHGRTALHLVTGRQKFCNKSKQILEMLLNHLPQLVDQTDKFENTALKLAAEKGHHEAIDILVSHGAEVNKCDNSGNTPLHCAVDKKKLDVVKLLLQNGADVALQNERRETPLHRAVTAESTEIVEVLLCYHASPNTKNKSEHSPKDLAKMKNLDDISELLENPDTARNKASMRSAFGKGARVKPDSGGNLGGDEDVLDALTSSLKTLIAVRDTGGRQQGSGNIYNVIVKEGGYAAVGRGSTFMMGEQSQGQVAAKQRDDGADRRETTQPSSECAPVHSTYVTNAINNKGNLVIGDDTKLVVENAPSLCEGGTEDGSERHCGQLSKQS